MAHPLPTHENCAYRAPQPGAKAAPGRCSNTYPRPRPSLLHTRRTTYATPNHHTQTLAAGETLTLDNTTIPDPETGQPIPTATLRLPTWRLRELAATLTLCEQIHTLITQAQLPNETDLAHHLTAAAYTLSTSRH
jgi:hypothetical protein